MNLFDDDSEGQERPVPNRRLVRERAMQALYAHEIGRTVGGESIDYLASRILYPEFSQSRELLEFAQQLLFRVHNYSNEADEIIKALAENWDFHRIAPIDKVLLRMGIVEMIYFSEIPTKVTINEVIEIAKRYSTEKSGIFLNGVLDAALARLKEEGRLKKSGRGLVE